MPKPQAANHPQPAPSIGVVIMTYGSATTAQHVADYMHHIYGPQASSGTIAEFEERYRLVGHSPLIEITKKQASLMQAELGPGYIVQAGMQHSAPSIASAVGECRTTGVHKLIGIILSPQFSSFIMEGYRKAFFEAAKSHAFAPADITLVGPWPTQKHFIELLTNRTKTALDQLTLKHGTAPPVVFTTHSLPERVVAKDPSYLEQLTATTEAVVAALDRPDLIHYAAYQSAGHTPEPWLKPDLVDILAQLQEEHQKAVLIVPIQFLSDHLEILYDLDIAGAQQCRDYGLEYNRIQLPNTDPLFIRSLSDLVTQAAHQD